MRECRESEMDEGLEEGEDDSEVTSPTLAKTNVTVNEEDMANATEGAVVVDAEDKATSVAANEAVGDSPNRRCCIVSAERQNDERLSELDRLECLCMYGSIKY